MRMTPDSDGGDKNMGGNAIVYLHQDHVALPTSDLTHMGSDLGEIETVTAALTPMPPCRCRKGVQLGRR